MSVHERLRHHRAKIQYRACEDEIFRLLALDFSRRLIHEQLTKEGRISMAYITLCQFIRRTKAKEAEKNSPPAASAKVDAPRPVTGSGPRHIAVSNGKFPDPREMNPEEAI